MAKKSKGQPQTPRDRAYASSRVSRIQASQFARNPESRSDMLESRRVENNPGYTPTSDVEASARSKREKKLWDQGYYEI